MFTKPNYYWWIVPVITSHVGAVLGAWIYYLAIGRKDQITAATRSLTPIFRNQLAATGE